MQDIVYGFFYIKINYFASLNGTGPVELLFIPSWENQYQHSGVIYSPDSYDNDDFVFYYVRKWVALGIFVCYMFWK